MATNQPSSNRGLTSWIWSPNNKTANKSSTQDPNAGSNKDLDEIQHRKMLARILRYIATMHHSLATSSSSADSGGTNKRGNNGPSFVAQSRNPQMLWNSFYFQDSTNNNNNNNKWADISEEHGVLFSTQNFQHLFSIQADSSKALFESPPFSFYAASAGQSSALSLANKKRAWGDAFRNPLGGSSSNSHTTNHNTNNNSGGGNDGKACWLRLTRLTVPEPPSMVNPAVRRYLQQWRHQTPEFQCCESLKDILTLETLTRAPKVPPEQLGRAKEIKTFLKEYKIYLRKRAFQQALEPIYDQLFEWIQQTRPNDELVWGLGHARMMTSDNTVVNGPLLEVQMEVELAGDGALLVRPREHVGVALNREVIAALMSVTTSESSGNVNKRVEQMHRYVAELDPLQIAPGQPATYIPFFKRLVMELSSGGRFQMSAKVQGEPPMEPNKMLITEAWCLYSRPKPNSVWARDATAFADQLLLPSSGVDGEGLQLSRATWALTHGPSAVACGPNVGEKGSSSTDSGRPGVLSRLLTGVGVFQSTPEEDPSEMNKEDTQNSPIVFPLPASEAQDRIADLLLRQKYSAIVVEGPPGTGKTHTIANIISAFLSRGQRVLVTSKGAPALSVIRTRLPKGIQDLCVDVSLSESSGMRQLQQTVERLANRVACVSTHIEAEKCELLLRNIEALEMERCEIDSRLAEASDRKRMLIQKPDGQKLVNGLIKLIEETPWLIKAVASWDTERLLKFRDLLASLVDRQQNEGMTRVFLGCPSPPSSELISLVSAKAGMPLSSLKLATTKLLASVPLLGSAFSSRQEAVVQGQIAAIEIDGRLPITPEDWKLVLQVLRFEDAIAKFHRSHVEHLVKHEGWPEKEVYDRVGPQSQQRIIRKNLLNVFNQVLDLRKLSSTLHVSQEIEDASECYALDARRSLIATQIQSLAEDLVDARVVTELGRTFSPEAQSALIKFSQIAARAKFNRASQPSSMSTRQRRHRQEYLDAFDRCVRYIPCWVMTSSQISDFLPSECLFDLVIIDEASQSDITVLPGMLRGKQWLIVGDSKQVSPTESFVSEESIDNLRAALPDCPLKDSLLPGQSFFDLCAQAYPQGRVVLKEHFRCAPEIINFSNQQFYDGRLIPLRLPTSTERLTPSLIDVRVPDGVKEGKTNEKECDVIVRMVTDFVNDESSACLASAKTIGIISLLGEEQSRMICGRLRDSIGARKFKEHDIRVGDPPAFQGDERDIIFLSMVCSPKNVPTQNRVMHAQRINVALSRARDRMVLVRSVDRRHISNSEDVKHLVIEFFELATKAAQADGTEEDCAVRKLDTTTFSFRVRAEALLEKLLKNRGFVVRRMGVVWHHALCVEHPELATRAGLCIENAGESQEEWTRVVMQQKSIERVGWKCLRVDGFSMLTDHHRTFQKVLDFLASVGIDVPTPINHNLQDDGDSTENDAEMVDAAVDEGDSDSVGVNRQAALQNRRNAMGDNEVVAISSDEENEEEDRKIEACFPDMVRSHNADVNDEMDASEFGQVVELDFLGAVGTRGGSFMDDSSAKETGSVASSARSTSSSRRRRKSALISSSRNALDRKVVSQQGDDENADRASADEGSTSSKRRKNRRRLDRYSRDGRWYPGRTREDNDQEDGWYDTDSDLADDPAGGGADEDEDYEPGKKS